MSKSTIKYRINSVTSQSPNYPASNLTNENTTLGWQSEYSPSYPQQINIQFFTPIRTKTVKLVFHQYKIPSCVQVFVRLTSKQNYRKLGYVIPNQNSQSNYEHKEIKTLYFEFPCNYIKLVFYQNYKNQMNLFEQIGLEELVVEGETMTYSQIRNLDLVEDQSTDQETMTNDLDAPQNNQPQSIKNNKKPFVVPPTGLEQTATIEQISKRFNEVYQHLENQKLQAIDNQDFQLASHLKNAIQSFKDIQNQIFNLEIQKKQALEDEDFDKCHRLKQQIAKKKQQFQYRVEQLVNNEENFMAEHSHSRIYQGNEPLQGTTDKKSEDIRDYFSSTPQRVSQKAMPIKQRHQEQSIGKNYVDHNDQIIPAVRNKLLGIKPNQNNENQYESSGKSRLINKNNGSKSPRDNKQSKSPPKSPNKKIQKSNVQQRTNDVKSPILQYQYDQQTQKKGQNNIRIEQYASNLQGQQQLSIKGQLNQLTQRFKHYDLQPLDLKLRLKIQCHFGVIQQPYWQMAMNKSWKVKKQALQYVRQNVPISSKQTYIAAMQFISFSINDNHTQVQIQTLVFLRKIIQEGNYNQVIFTLPHLPYFIQTIMNSLLNLINSTNRQLSEQSYNLYLLLGMVNFLPIQQIIIKLIKHKQTAKATPQYIFLKIGLMISIIQKYNQANKYYKEIIQWAIGFLEDPNHKVRNQASYILLVFTDILGQDKVIAQIKDKPKLMEIFYTLLNQSSLQEQSKVDQNSKLIDQSSRLTDRNQSKIEENPSLLANKSRSKQKLSSLNKNQSQLSQNQSSLSKRSQDSRKLQNPWNSGRQNDKKQQKQENSHHYRIQEGQEDQQLEYSKQSDFYGSSIKKASPSNVFMNRGYHNEQFSNHQDTQNEIKVLDQQEEQKYRQDEVNQQSSYQQQDQNHEEDQCDFCFAKLNGQSQREHLISDCPVICYCEQCHGKIYLRQMIDHLTKECTNSTYHQKCKRCGLVFNINEINEHVGQGLCRLQRGEGWERCQFCGQDILADDNEWVNHSLKCPNLPQKHHTETENATQKNSQHEY